MVTIGAQCLCLLLIHLTLWNVGLNVPPAREVNHLSLLIEICLGNYLIQCMADEAPNLHVLVSHLVDLFHFR